MKLHITNSVLFNANYDPPEEGSICFEIADDTEEIVLPEGICAIADKAFLLCKNLKKVCVPRGVQKIGKEAFASCYQLREVQLPEGLTHIDEEAFSVCQNLQSICLPESIAHIPGSAFNFCTALTTISLPNDHPLFRFENGLLIYKNDTLVRALPALHEVNIPSGIRIIANHALLACRNLSSVFLPDGVEEIGEHAFYHCQQMLSVRFPQSLRKIGDLAFFSCESLSNIVLPDGVEEIGHMAFAFCRSLMHIHLPDRLTCLEHSLLRSCEKLQHITIPENVTSIQHEIFCCCSALSQITFHEHQFYELYNVLSGSSKPFLHCIAPIDQFPQRAQIRLAIGFALNEDTYPPEIAQSYLSYLRENTFALHRAACIYPQLLRIMCRERMISVEHIPVFLKQASYFDNVEITALLLGYQHALQPEIPDALEWDID